VLPTAGTDDIKVTTSAICQPGMYRVQRGRRCTCHRNARLASAHRSRRPHRPRILPPRAIAARLEVEVTNDLRPVGVGRVVSEKTSSHFVMPCSDTIEHRFDTATYDSSRPSLAGRDGHTPRSTLPLTATLTTLRPIIRTDSVVTSLPNGHSAPSREFTQPP
jgi:hypothetical protein